MMRQPTDTDEHVVGGSRRPGFSTVGPWIADPHPPQLSVLEEAQTIAHRLASKTDWALERLLDAVGCPSERRKDPNSLDEDVLRACVAHLEWVESLMNRVDLVADRRAVAGGACRLTNEAGRRSESARVAMSHGRWSGEALVELGEVELAFQVARRHLPEQLAAPWRQLDLANPFGDVRAHLSHARLVQLHEDRDDLLGSEVARRMRRHLGECTPCRSAYAHATALHS